MKVEEDGVQNSLFFQTQTNAKSDPITMVTVHRKGEFVLGSMGGMKNFHHSTIVLQQSRDNGSPSTQGTESKTKGTLTYF